MKKLTFTLLCLFLGIGLVNAQTSEVTGNVTSLEGGEPIIGASIVVKGTTTGTVTDFDGNFKLSVPHSAKILIFSYVGMTAKEEAIKPVMNVKMESSSQALDEVMVVAYGTAKKSSFTGSAASIGSKTLDLRPISNATQALEGAAPGIQVSSANGQPGESPSIRIRGFGSINASSTPLYVVDGSIYNGSMADINPADIESMTILKDAASTSLYGSSAGNGVILVTTKQGKSGKPTISLNINQGFSGRSIPEYDRVNTWDYYPIMWEQKRNQYITKGKTPQVAGEQASKEIFGLLKYNPFKGVDNKSIVTPDGLLNPAATTLLWGDDMDWEDAISRTGYRGEYNVSYSSSTEKTDSYVSLGYLKDNGYVIKSDFERFSGRANINIKPVKWLKTGFNIAANRTTSSTANDDSSTGYVNPFYFSRNIGPIYPIHEHDRTTGDYILDKNNNKIYDYMSARGSGASSGRHIVAETEFNDRKFTRDGVNARTYADLMLFEGFKATINASLENTNEKVSSYDNKFVGDGQGSGRLSKTDRRRSTVTFNQLLSYNKSFGKHSIDALLGHESYRYTYEYSYGMRQGQTVDGLMEYDNFITINDLTSMTDEYSKEGYFVRANYDYDNRFYGSVSYRRDGSSRFVKANRWGNFWSAGASWRIDQEAFLHDVSWLNSLKLRASYGQTGNDAILNENGYDDYYPYMTLYELGKNNGNEAGVLFYKYGNSNLSWETQVSTDVAVEFGLFDFLTGSVEYFNKQSDNLLFEVPTPPTSGVKNIWKNIGKVANYGVEINLNAQIIKNKNWEWNLGANATFIKNEIKKLPDDQQEIIDGTKKLMVGQSIYDYWLKEYRGVDPKDGSALYSFDSDNKEWNDKTCREINGEKMTTDQALARYHYAGSAIPDVYGGINTTVKYKGFELGAVFTYQIGGKIYNSSYANLMDVNSFGGALHTDALGRWQKEGDITNVPRMDASQATNFNAQSDRWLVNASYFNIKSLSLSYNLPKSFLSKFTIQNARLSVSGENLYMFNGMKGMNPQQRFSGVSDNAYLPSRTFTFGLNITL
ncbi:MAG: TonB-dependent receptor [Tannerellaceae bacterium]